MRHNFSLSSVSKVNNFCTERCSSRVSFNNMVNVFLQLLLFSASRFLETMLFFFFFFFFHFFFFFFFCFFLFSRSQRLKSTRT
jgi:hypothetical protein